jgi:flagellar hook protein FlgE
MGFETALSGLNAAANNLAVTSNNIANANTTGFKDSRAEFADIFASNIGGGNLGGVTTTQPGAGVKVAEDAQQFTQGTTTSTGNSLDMAINGQGFFTLAANPSTVSSLLYTRSGAFEVDKNGFITNSQGQALLAYKPNGATAAAGFSTGVLTPVSLSAGMGLPIATTKVSLGVNLDAGSTPIGAPFNPLNSSTYTAQTSGTIYDSLGVSHKLTSYFVAGTPTPPTSNWTVYHYITDNPASPVSVDTAPAGTTLTFDSNGKLTAPANGQVPLAPYVTGTSAANISITMNYTGSTQLSSAFGVNALTQDGLTAGNLTGISIDGSGVISANYSNGSTTPLGKVALTQFPNPQGLTQTGNASWTQSFTSGAPILGNAGVGQFGQIQSGSLEQSNVDLSAQLVNLIVAQQTYQANSQAISAENKIIDTILNIR